MSYRSGTIQPSGLLSSMWRSLVDAIVLNPDTLQTAEAVDGMRQAFEARAVRKWYHAVVVCGEGARLAPGESGVITQPLDGKEARTRWRVLEVAASLRHGQLALLELRPRTGRTHQLRRHCAETLRAPILGDTTHGAAAASNERGCGLHLCAVRVAFAHPCDESEAEGARQVDVRREAPPKFAARLRRERERHAKFTLASSVV